MSIRYLLFLAIACFAFVPAVQPCSAADGDAAIRILLVTGGHGYDREALHRMLREMPGASFEEIVLPKDQDRLCPAIKEKFDCLVFHDQSRFALTDTQKAELTAMWSQGMPTVMLHHSIISHNDVPLFREVFGAAYIVKAMKIDGVEYPSSSYFKPTDVALTIVDKTHPIVAGVPDFTINDEVFQGLYISPKVHILAETNHPKSDKAVVWTNQYGKSRVFALIQGHDRHAFDDANYRRLFYQGVRWTVGK